MCQVVMVYTFHSSTQESEADIFLVYRVSSEQPGLLKEILSRKISNNNNNI